MDCDTVSDWELDWDILAVNVEDIERDDDELPVELNEPVGPCEGVSDIIGDNEGLEEILGDEETEWLNIRLEVEEQVTVSVMNWDSVVVTLWDTVCEELSETPGEIAWLCDAICVMLSELDGVIDVDWLEV